MRVTTRADWDGLVSAALLSVVEKIDSYRFIEPGPFQSGALLVTNDDIIANLPFREKCGMWFDHHATNETSSDFKGSWWIAPSAARVIVDYYKNDKLKDYEKLVEETDKIDSGQLTMDDVQNPKGFVLVSATLEGKKLDDEPYWLHLIDLIRQNNIEKTMIDELVEERCVAYMTNNQEYGQAIHLYSDMVENVLVTDFRKVWHGEPGNRFLAYTLFPESDIWVRAQDNPNDPKRIHISVGRSIFLRTSEVHVGKLMAKHGGGGHAGAGSCRPLKEDGDRALKEIVEECRK